MITYEFKAGQLGLASGDGREADYTLGVYVQAKLACARVVVAGVPVGRHIRGDEMRGGRDKLNHRGGRRDAPLLPHRLTRLTAAADGPGPHRRHGHVARGISHRPPRRSTRRPLHRRRARCAPWTRCSTPSSGGEEAFLDSLVVRHDGRPRRHDRRALPRPASRSVGTRRCGPAATARPSPATGNRRLSRRQAMMGTRKGEQET